MNIVELKNKIFVKFLWDMSDYNTIFYICRLFMHASIKCRSTSSSGQWRVIWNCIAFIRNYIVVVLIIDNTCINSTTRVFFSCKGECRIQFDSFYTTNLFLYMSQMVCILSTNSTKCSFSICLLLNTLL